MISLAIVIAIIVIAGIALRLVIPIISGESVASGIVSFDGESFLGDCPDTPNCQGSESSRESQSVDRFTLTQPAANAISSLANIVTAMPGTTIVTQTEQYLHATVTTKLMGYTDDLEFLLSNDAQSVQARSASRIGKSDLGANAKRLEHLRTLADGNI